MKLYYVPGACSMAPHIALREAGLSFEIDKMDPATRRTEKGEDYLKVNPKGSVPALRLDNGEVLTEAAVILQYIADQKPASGLAPAAGSMPRYRLAEWLNYISSEVHKQLGPFFNPKLPPEWRENQINLLSKRFDILAERLKSHAYLMGDNFTIADAYLFTVLNWCNLFKLDLSKWPALTDYLGRIAARPAVQAVLKAEGLAK
jgi:glutathione S-transferase